MGTPASEQIRRSLLASRSEADRLVAIAERKAGALAEAAGDADRALAAARIERLNKLRDQLRDQQRQIEVCYAAMAEAMAISSLKLAEIARNADFSAPPWPSGIRRTVEIKLAETREITFRFETGGAETRTSQHRV